MKIVEITATAVSVPVPPEGQVTLGLGRTIKRDAVVVKVMTESGIVGWGESHHGRAPGAVAHLVNTTLRDLLLGMDASDVVGCWSKIYKMQLGSHGMGTACCLAMSGIDMALWDIRAKAVGWPLYKLLGGSAKPLPAYAGGISLGWQEPNALVEEARSLIEHGYGALKLRIGDTPVRDIQRVAAVRNAFDDDLVILTDANTGYTLEDARIALPRLEKLGVRWLEEPFPAHDYRRYAEAATFSHVPLALGENTYTRFEFQHVIERGDVQILQPDIAKTGGITEGLRIAAMASAWKLPIHPHTSISGISMAATVHFLAALENGGYFETDVSKGNLLRDELVSTPFAVDANGCVTPSDRPGIGVDVNEEFIAAHPVIEGPCYV